jgi:hypothetical protein
MSEELNEAQRAALLASTGNGLWGDGRFDFVGDRRGANELYDTGLIEPADANGLWACYRLTDSGRAALATLLPTNQRAPA